MSICRICRRRRAVYRMPLILLPLLLILLPLKASSLPCDGNRCNTGSCDETGACICDLPDPSTILDGDRPFLGGKFCDEEQTMCDGTNSFWCEHGAICEEIVHGENYTCRCRPGHTGLHCEHIGAPCGQIFCFHEAECLFEGGGDVCECPPDWKGSIDCSVPTRTHTIINTTATRLPHVENGGHIKWFVVFVAISCSLVAVGSVFVFGKKCLKKNETADPKFQQLSQIQIHGFLDDDENDSLVAQDVHNDIAHL